MNKTVNRADLGALLSPSSVAVIGASDNAGRIGGRPVHYLKNHGYDGAIYPVNPKREIVQGLTCYPDIAALPEAPDLAIVAVPGHVVIETVSALADRGTRGCVVFSAGFAEVGDAGEAGQLALEAISRDTGIRIVGPNCLGIFNANIGMYATFSTALEQNTPTGGNIAIASQSGAYGSHLSMIATRRGLPVGYWITTGNECDVQVAESIEWLAQRDDVNAIIAYAEGVKDGARLVNALELARASRTAVIFLKTGRSEVGAMAATSHTASLTGEDDVFDAAFRQLGVYRAHDTEDALDIAQAASSNRFPGSRRTGLITVSGGVGIHMADVAEELGLEISPMPQAAQKSLTELLPYASALNPVDVTAQVINDAALFDQFLETTLRDGGYDSVVIYFTFVAAAEFMIDPMTRALESVRERYPDRVIVLSIIAKEETVRRYESTGCLVFEDPWRATRAVAGLAMLNEAFEAPALVRSRNDHAAQTLKAANEAETKILLADAGIGAPAEKIVTSATDATDFGEAIGYPVVLKVVSPDIAHKTEAGGVALDIQDSDALRKTFTQMDSHIRQSHPEARVDGYLVAAQEDAGIETIIGIKNDPVFGPVVVFGAGGVLVEVLDEAEIRLAPFSVDEAHKMIAATRVSRILAGVRGGAPCDVDALARGLSAVSEFAWRHRDSIESMDINPVVVREAGNGIVALDALLETRS